MSVELLTRRKYYMAINYGDHLGIEMYARSPAFKRLPDAGGNLLGYFCA
ncbi:hypothetical protein MOP44_19740 [Occallatibacter riparius]|uniref:Uncharacterized protein n=1 Tax=Occallatibacter riparius TaxID=1002689 RepID=A0A9J7BIZ9_9BACT|nr:hypothetical protein [Occallatibacter riparius]UWZ82792.1 hypothetical protein MOP44_19740 [Occallatibacter riparius]